MGNMRLMGAAERFAAEVGRLLPKARRVAPGTADHLERAVRSLLLNAAEGCASRMPRIAISRFDTARREANEARVALRLLVGQGVFPQAEIWKAHALGTVCMKMLAAAMHGLGHPAPTPPPDSLPQKKTRSSPPK
jgi:four helix bundle protein